MRWPEPGSELPPSAIRTTDADKELDIVFGSCRVAVPHEAPFTEPKDETEEGHEVDALWVLAKQMAAGERDDWPEQLFLLGDQVYVDEGSPKTRRTIKERRGTATEASAPRSCVAIVSSPIFFPISFPTSAEKR